MPCYRCGRIQTDPAKGEQPWARGVAANHQVLICPPCQQAVSRWEAELESCPWCGSTRLSMVMGSIVCRQCNRDWVPDSSTDARPLRTN